MLCFAVNGQNIYSRHCVAEAENAASNACAIRSVLPQVKIIACETCTEDGCNENFSVKPGELKQEDNKDSAMTTIPSMQMISMILGIVWLLF